MTFVLNCPAGKGKGHAYGKAPVRLGLDYLKTFQAGPILGAETGHVLAPWVAIDFVDQSGEANGAVVTVGNNSSTVTDPPNCAVIKSFEFGYSDGLTCRLTIHDTHGGAFEEFIKHLVKDWVCLKNLNPATLLMRVQFGWAKGGCSTPLPSSVSPCYYVMCDSIETNFTQGKLIFEITGKDLMSRSLEGGVEAQSGGLGSDGEHLMDALERLFTNSVAPNVGSVIVKASQDGTNLQSGGGKSDDVFQSDDPNERRRGPKGQWVTSGRDKLHAARAWLASSRSINGRGWIINYNFEQPSGEIVIWENNMPSEDEGAQGDGFWDRNCVGTYIVNGGNHSPVIEFNPKVRWNFSTLPTSGGNLGDTRLNSMGEEGAKNPGTAATSREKAAGAGSPQQTTPSDTDKDRHGERAVEEVAAAQAVDKKTLAIVTPQSIEADLVLIGDPTMMRPSEAILQKNVSIIVINPIHLADVGGGKTEWLATPPVNSVFSNKAWMIRSVSHRVEAGSFTTTLGVFLAGPGIDVETGEPFGAWQGGWKPVPCE